MNSRTRLIDTPGVREFGLWQVTRENVEAYFPEIEALRRQCQFINCQHDQEEHCAVKQAALAGTVDVERLASFLRIRASL